MAGTGLLGGSRDSAGKVILSGWDTVSSLLGDTVTVPSGWGRAGCPRVPHVLGNVPCALPLGFDCRGKLRHRGTAVGV